MVLHGRRPGRTGTREQVKAAIANDAQLAQKLTDAIMAKCTAVDGSVCAVNLRIWWRKLHLQWDTKQKEKENMKDYTHICIVLDASGSMASIEGDTKGSFNSFIKAQKAAGGKTVFDLYQFSDEVKRLVEHVDLATFGDDLMASYKCSGCTALNDAVCIAIDTLGQELAAMKEEDRPENVLMVIITDGFENASRKFTSKDVKDRITHQTEKYNWEFQYLAANQDAFASGAELGITKDNCANFVASPSGMVHTCALMCDRATQMRNRKNKKH